ncbi:hypothetical protein ACWEQG_14075 [Microbispora sp. NPDC004025]
MRLDEWAGPWCRRARVDRAFPPRLERVSCSIGGGVGLDGAVPG